MDDYKENNGIASLTAPLAAPRVAALSTKNSRSSLRSKDGGSPLLPPIKLDKIPSKDYKRLDRQYSELLVKYNHVVVDLSQLQQELVIKNNTINDQLNHISNYERFLDNIKLDYAKTKQMLESELQYYKEMVQEYQLKFLNLNHELEYYKKLEFKEIESVANEDHEDKYQALFKKHRVLKSNYELEQSAKAMLIDQIESLAKENRQLKETLYSNSSSSNIDGEEHSGSSYNYDATLGDLTYNYDTHTMNVNSDEDEDIDELGDYRVSDIELAPHSSPIKKDVSYETPRIPSLIQTENFQFPPSPDPHTKSKRQSLPIRLPNEEFILSPLKLANQEEKHIVRPEARPNHSRYSSHDILPIRVEFEDGRRSTSSRLGSLINSIKESELEGLKAIDSPELDEDNPIASALSKLNGESSSSKRSSILNLDANTIGNDLTKQEITKLKFELQSLKLYNEKLLSYIGFELQKQNKNIKRIRKNQKIEYSDSKLIERSRELLIQKKRVLRSVSINAILPKNYHNGLGIISKGLLPVSFEGPEDEEEDDYGFFNVDDKFNKRIFSNGLSHYYELENDGMLKKHKSTNFTHDITDFDTSIDGDEEDEDTSTGSATSDEDVTVQNIGLFTQIKYLLTGARKPSSTKKKKSPESAVDDTLRYQFLTVAIGILILGIRFGHHNQSD